jgi:hypothetical protein
MFIFVCHPEKYLTSDTYSKESLEKLHCMYVSHMSAKATHVVVTWKTAFLLSHSGTIYLHMKCILFLIYIYIILIPCIINYVEFNQLNSLNYILLYFSFALAATCFGKTMPPSGRSMRMALFCRNM